MAQMTSTGVEDRRDPLYRKKHAGVPGNGGQTAEHERTETGKSVLNTTLADLGADDAAKRAFAEAAMNATSPLDLIDRRVEAVQTYIADKYDGQVTSVSFVSDGDRLMVMSASDANEAPVETEMLDAIEADLNDVIPTSAMPTFSEGMTLFAGKTVETEFDRYPAIGDESLAEFTDRIVAKWSVGQHPDNLPEVAAAAREYAYDTYNSELNEHALSGGEITPAMLDGLNEPNTRYFTQHYPVTIPDAPESLAADIPGVTRPVETWSELTSKPSQDRIDGQGRTAERRWLLHEQDGKKVYAEVSVRHMTSIPGDYSGRKVSAMASHFNVYTEEPHGMFVSKVSHPLQDGVRLDVTPIGRYNAKRLGEDLDIAEEMVKNHFDSGQIRQIMSNAHAKAEAITFGLED
ncbi:hypothetical protein [Aeromicrobium sp. 179-A 4D2 NHS]|uniref:hypothetical protein n=1 Tax=Aeromicrobium sp. 179-A 4D2 NHS TaxID=3142375 RepID=UPI0039A0A927